MDDSNIVIKIKKLLSLATSSNEHEAMAALGKARQLMAEHELSEADCQDMIGGREVISLDRGEITSRSKYKHVLLNAIGPWCQVDAIGIPITSQRYALRWIGRRHRVEIAVHMYEYLLDEIDRLTPRNYRYAQKRQFQNGCGIKLAERIESKIAAAKSNSSNSLGNANAIVPIDDYRQENDAYLQRNFPQARNKNIQLEGGSYEGYNAGNDISIDPHLVGSNRSASRSSQDRGQ